MKENLRAEYRIKRKNAFSKQKEEQIFQAVCYSEYLRYQTFFVYLSFGSEVDTKKIIEFLLAKGKTVLVPRIEEGEMSAVPYGKLQKHQLGFEQPQEGEDTPCEVAFTPLLAVDGRGYRLGYGGGYYDRYFATHQTVQKVGLCFEEQRVNSLPNEAYDIPLDAVITEKNTVYFER